MQQYHQLLQRILDTGVKKADRTGTGTLSVFGEMMRFDLSEGFPLLTTKRVHLKSVIHELLWLISGNTNILPLVQAGVGIWTDWPLQNYNKWRKWQGDEPVSEQEFHQLMLGSAEFAERWGSLGDVYGKNWRSWEHFEMMRVGYGLQGEQVTGYIRRTDQLAGAIELIKNNPDSRRILVNAWNVGELDNMALPPCHFAFQFYVQNGKLSCVFHMRSVDTFLGLPFNLASYALLTMMVAQVCELDVGELIWTGGDCHLYLNHLEQAQLLLSREPRQPPRIKLNPEVKDIDKFVFEDFQLEGYTPWPAIRADVSV